jgi:hypothetical protein
MAVEQWDTHRRQDILRDVRDQKPLILLHFLQSPSFSRVVSHGETWRDTQSAFLALTRKATSRSYSS